MGRATRIFLCTKLETPGTSLEVLELKSNFRFYALLNTTGDPYILGIITPVTLILSYWAYSHGIYCLASLTPQVYPSKLGYCSFIG